MLIRVPDEELELDEEELELELDEEELELEELELEELELLDEELELDELLELVGLEPVVPPQPDMIDASTKANEAKVARRGNIEIGKAPIFIYLVKFIMNFRM